MTLQVSAPGKLFLIGEYAVLDGAPALLSAVDRRVRVEIEAAANGCWSLTAPDIGIDTLDLGAHGALPEQLPAATRARLGVYQAVWSTLAEHGALPAAALTIRIDSNAFSSGGHKLGLGASAAVAATLTSALSRAAGLELDHAKLCRLAMTAHRHAQHGAGSGADVATSVHGGVIEYQAHALQTTRTWPQGITGMAVITGNGASTTNLVGRVAAYAERAPGRYSADMAALKQLSIDAHATLTDAHAFLQLVSDYFLALQKLDANAHAGIILDRHRELAALATQHGGVFKTTGAGGGDLGLGFARSGDPARRLSAAFTAAGAHTVALKFGAAGLQIDA